jgi:hypothetical protein
MLNKIQIVLLSFLISQLAFSQVGGIKNYTFLQIPISARQAALGGNPLGLYDNDLNLALYNPAGLNDTLHQHLSFNYINYFADVNLGYLAYAHDFKKYGTFSGGIQFIDYGKFIRADAAGNQLGNFSANELAFNIGWGMPLPFKDSLFSVGANIKNVFSTLDNRSSYALAADLAINFYQPKWLFGASFLIKNIGRPLKTYTTFGIDEKLPYEIQIGVSKKLKKAPIRFFLTYENLERFRLFTDSTTQTTSLLNEQNNNNRRQKNREGSFTDNFFRHIVLGAEINVTKAFFLRMGYNFQRNKELKLVEKSGMAGLSFGFGLRVYKFHVSYALAGYHLAGLSNQFTLTTSIGAFQ